MLLKPGRQLQCLGGCWDKPNPLSPAKCCLFVCLLLAVPWGLSLLLLVEEKGSEQCWGAVLQGVKKGLRCALTGRKIFWWVFFPEAGRPLLEWSAQLMV